MTTVRPSRAPDGVPTSEPGQPGADRSPLRRHRRDRALLQAFCVAVTLFMGFPLYLIAVSAFSSPESLNTFPKLPWPTDFSTATMGTFLGSTGIVPAFLNSLLVGAPALSYRFAGGFMLVVPALVFLVLMRRYLLNMWGTTLR